MNGLKIGIITHNYPSYKGESKDAGKFIYNFSHELAKKHKVFVLCPDYKGKKSKDKKVPVTWFNWGSSSEKFGDWKFYSPLSPIKFYKLWKSGNACVIDFAQNNNIDYLICFWNFPAGLWGLYAKKKLEIPYATWALGSDIFIYPKLPIIRQLTQWVLKNADKKYGNSIKINKEIKKLSGCNSQFLPTSNPVDIKKFTKPDLSSKKTNFLFLGRLEKVKGPDLLLQACKILSQKNAQFTLTMIGGGSLENKLRNFVSKNNLEDKVSILGYVEDQKKVNGYLKFSDCLIIPSKSESFPLVITEALQMNLPIIGSNVGDIPHFVSKNKLGFVYRKNDLNDLVLKMNKMTKSANKFKKQNTNVTKKLYKDFQLTSIANKLISSLQYPKS